MQKICKSNDKRESILPLPLHKLANYSIHSCVLLYFTYWLLSNSHFPSAVLHFLTTALIFIDLMLRQQTMRLNMNNSFRKTKRLRLSLIPTVRMNILSKRQEKRDMLKRAKPYIMIYPQVNKINFGPVCAPAFFIRVLL